MLREGTHAEDRHRCRQGRRERRAPPAVRYGLLAAHRRREIIRGTCAARPFPRSQRALVQLRGVHNSARLAEESEPVLSAVMEVLQAHKEVIKLEVRGHTDSRGGAAANLDLSNRRAASVMKWLITHGIAPERLGSKGFGQTRPIDTNDTEEGRKNNRRVEFRITATAAD